MLNYPVYEVFPTHVGMIRQLPALDDHTLRVPHARGDDPNSLYITNVYYKCSPRTWG